YSSERLRTTDFGGSCGTASTVVRVPVSGEPRLSKPLLRAVYCVGGCDGVFARKISATLLLPEQAASRAERGGLVYHRRVAAALLASGMGNTVTATARRPR